MRKNWNRKAAMEMSVGTIVTIVLGVTLLVGGIFFVQKILTSAKGVVDLTDQQLRDEVNKLFSEENEITVYPSTRFIEIKQQDTDGVGFGIKNLGTEVDTYSYSTTATPGANCPSLSGENALKWIIIGGSENGISVESGGSIYRKILFEIPVGAPLCTVRYRIEVTSQKGRSLDDAFDVKIKAK
jgi:hypothetical protein